MLRDTSVEAYNKIVGNGLLSRLRTEVYKVVYHYGPISAQEAWKILKEDDRTSVVKNRRDGITQRFSELERMGVIEIAYHGSCEVSGHRVIKWKVTGNLPKRADKRDELVQRARRLKAKFYKAIEELKEYDKRLI